MWKSIALSLLNRALSILMGELWQFLQDTVAVYMNAALTDHHKREAVIQDAFLHCQKTGQAISASLLNLGIEAAIQIVRDKTGG